MYLGYSYKKELSILTSKLTLHFNKEINLHFFSEVEVEGKWLQGFCVSGLSQELPRALALEMIKDFKNVFINKENISEVLFVICENKEVLNSWYKMRWDGLVSTKLCREFNYFETHIDEKLIIKRRKELELEFADKLQTA